MARLTRRDLLKTGLAATAGAVGTRLVPEAAGDALAGRAPQTAAAASLSANSPRQRLLLNAHWRFQLGHANDPAKDQGFEQMRRGTLTFAKATGVARPAQARFDDSGWKEITLPHDWALDLPFQNDPALPDHGGKPLGREYPETSIGWYRRLFDLAPEDANRRIWLEFDGVFRNAMVFLNGQYIGQNFSGYAPFRFDVTDYCVATANALALRVDATTGEGWFYEGAGIYRHVWLLKTSALHAAPDSLVVRAAPAAGSAALDFEADAVNDSNAPAEVWGEWHVYDAAGHEVATARSTAQRLAAWSGAALRAKATLRQPALWSLEAPNLYRAVFSLRTAAGEADRDETAFGVRSLRFDAAQGLFLNDRPVKVQGTCNHHDHAGVGAAVPDAVQEFRVRKLKEMGSNACRTSHNPPADAFLDACDRLGLLVMCETRMNSATPEGLSQLERMIRRARNHPSIMLWSLGNEEGQQSSPTGAHVAATMKRLAFRLDPTRTVTQAMNGGWEQTADGAPARLGISGVVDVQGCNYGEENIDKYHRDFPQTPVIGSETASAVATRGVYFADRERGYVTAYDTNVPGTYAKTAEAWWKFYAARAFLAGGFAWTGFDYRGEPSPSQWPCVSSHFGILDSCGFPKDTYFYYRAWWTQQPVLHLFPHWNWSGREGQQVAVWCHSNLDSVELFLNGASLGARTVERLGHVEWMVPYSPGALEARGSRNGSVALTERRETTGAAAALALSTDRAQVRADGEDVAICAVEVRDAQGRAVPDADHLVRFTVSGPGKIIGVGNGDPASHEADRASERRAFHGLCMALVQAGTEAGPIQVEAAADGLATATLTLAATPGTPRPAVPAAAPLPPGGRGGRGGRGA